MTYDILFTSDDPNTINTAREYLRSTASPDATNSGVTNVYSGKYRHVILPRMVHAAFVRSEMARGTITRLDVSAARKLEGVVAVFTADDFQGATHAMWTDMLGPPSDTNPMPPLRVLAAGDVRFVGDPIAIVVAESRYLAEDGAELVSLWVHPTWRGLAWGTCWCKRCWTGHGRRTRGGAAVGHRRQ